MGNHSTSMKIEKVKVTALLSADTVMDSLFLPILALLAYFPEHIWKESGPS